MLLLWTLGDSWRISSQIASFWRLTTLSDLIPEMRKRVSSGMLTRHPNCEMSIALTLEVVVLQHTPMQ